MGHVLVRFYYTRLKRRIQTGQLYRRFYFYEAVCYQLFYQQSIRGSCRTFFFLSRIKEPRNYTDPCESNAKKRPPRELNRVPFLGATLRVQRLYRGGKICKIKK